jgi:hypothetical protein
MRPNQLSFAGWPGGARALAPELFRKREIQVRRQFDFLLRVFTPRTIFMEVGSSDCELSLRAAGYVERVWCVEAASPVRRPPCNLRWSAIGGVPLKSIDVAFSESIAGLQDVRQLLAPGGVWFVYGRPVAAALLRGAGFARVEYYAGGLRLPGALARLSRGITTTAAYQ